MEEAAGLLTRGSLPRRLPGPGASGISAGSISPYSGGTVPDLHRVPSPRSVVTAEPTMRLVHRSAVRAWLPVALWAAAIFAFSSVPSLSTGLGGWDLVLRKLAHAAEYAVLGALLLRACGTPRLAIVLGGLYAVSDELHQSFVRGRHAALTDVVIDTIGVTAGVLAWSRLRGRSSP
jgi:VanZ like family